MNASAGISPAAPPIARPGLDSTPSPPQESRPAIYLAIAALGLALLAGWALLRHMRSGAHAASNPSGRGTVTVVQGDFVRTVRLSGTIQALQAHNVLAPEISGEHLGSLVITHLAPSGSRVRKGDLLVEFDRQGQMRELLDKQAEYQDLVDQYDKTRAQQALAKAKDDTELKQAEDAMAKAQLEMRKNEILSRIDAEKNRESLDEATANLAQLRETYNLKRNAAAAELRILEIKRDRSRRAMDYARENSSKMAVHSPIAGLVVLTSIWKSGRMGQVQEGDEVRPGQPFMQVVDPGVMQVSLKVNQDDFPMLRIGQAVTVHLDAYPGLSLPGKVERISTIAMTSELSDRVRTLTAIVAIQGSDPRLLPDLSAAADVQLDDEPNSLLLPREALIEENGKYLVEARAGLGFVRRAVQVGAMNDLEAVISSGLRPGEVVRRQAAAAP